MVVQSEMEYLGTHRMTKKYRKKCVRFKEWKNEEIFIHAALNGHGNKRIAHSPRRIS
jgi:hypothetical protein